MYKPKVSSQLASELEVQINKVTTKPRNSLASLPDYLSAMRLEKGSNL